MTRQVVDNSVIRGVRPRCDRSWSRLLDTLAAHIDRQEAALRRGHGSPAPLEIDPPSAPLIGTDRLRAIELFWRCEALLDEATERAVTARGATRSAYRRPS